MAKEVECTMQFQGHAYQGKVYLESDQLLFRGDIRLKLPLSEVTAVMARSGVLNVVHQENRVSFQIGEQATAWAERIKNPPSRLTKLGLAAGSKVATVGKPDLDFYQDLQAAGTKLVELGKAYTVFYIASQAAALEEVASLAAKMAKKASLWIVYPKAVAAIREMEVITAGRAAGLKDTKVVAFSKTHTALRFSQPVTSSKRIQQTTA